MGARADPVGPSHAATHVATRHRSRQGHAHRPPPDAAGGLGVVWSGAGTRRQGLSQFGVGLGLMFLGLDFMKSGVADVTDLFDPQALSTYPSIVFLLAGVLVTAIIQIPAILIMVPVIIWVFSFAEPVPASIFAVWSIVVALSDNVLKPMLLGRGVDLPVLVVLLGAIGGMIKFGVIGLFIGAVILGLGYRIISDWIWPDESTVDPSGIESSS